MGKEQKIALYEDDLYGTEESKEETKNILVLRLSKEWYGIDILKVREIIEVRKITFLPSSPEHIIGIINLRGTILSVTDLKKIFGLTQEEITDKSRLIVVEHEPVQTALLADQVLEIIEIPLSKIKPTLSTISSEQAEYLDGECKINGRLIGILKLENIMKEKTI